VKPSDGTPETEATPLGFDALKWLGARRDGFLVSGAVLYGLGYLVWSYNAWRNHLGELPALEFQYLVSGIIPALILTTAWAGAVFAFKLRDKLLKVFEKYRFVKWLFLGSAIGIPWGLRFVQYLAGKGWIPGPIDKKIEFYAIPILIVAMYFTFVSTATERGHDVRKWSTRMYQYAVPIMFCWYSLVVYLDLYQRLPQELGGPQPRCAYVDLVRDETAPSTLAALAPPGSADSVTTGSKVIRSSRLDVYFSSGDYLLVRAPKPPAASKSGVSDKDEPLYELRKEVIRAVQWCR